MEKKYWFPAKPPGYGWGWGLPLTWQGWVVFVGFFVLLVAGAIFYLPDSPGWYLFHVFCLVDLLIFICARKGEPPGPFFRRNRHKGPGG
ncbi:hypothetical protein LK542_00550 [Massilia sp. IC2-477]|uniref:hypothetical protein n=1 Tax=Massilia sp. IC2-477 TaxID=2887198 RepID=UPI001D11B560|nr:hypothetical protein [Massilia sp. IC2-477]MCC2954099.1 hypothetical protein [Massilia sp. IC2-477]